MGKDSVAMRISFYDLTTVLDLMKGSISSSKRQNFNEFLKNWRQETISTNVDGSMEFSTTDSFYPAMRIFVPSLDTDARQFGMGNVIVLYCTLSITIIGVIKVFSTNLVTSSAKHWELRKCRPRL